MALDSCKHLVNMLYVFRTRQSLCAGNKEERKKKSKTKQQHKNYTLDAIYTNPNKQNQSCEKKN